jgi:D-alanyl-lipoteichoic acid acyltransferase DltB (MBOAT superfamily)
MLFNSLTFIVFFAIVLLLHNLPFSWKTKKFNLLIASYIFYAAWSPPFVILLWIVTLIDWFVARWLAKTEVESKRRALLILSLVSNLGILSYFKYGEFLLDNFTFLLDIVGIKFQPATSGIVLPVGISFYTFVTLSYTIDVYWRKIKPAKSFLDYALLVTFFPHLVAGPILRARQFLPQCITLRTVSSRQFAWGIFLLVLGLFEKIVLADGILAPIVDSVFAAKGDVNWFQGWLAVFSLGPQFFFDFSGYSLCAIGSALCLGFSFPDNFRFPFAAVGFLDLWRRWHITLSAWFKDYLYIPLSIWLRDNFFIRVIGKKKSDLQTAFNFILVMSLIGLWHGAAWHFVIFGTLQGVFMGVERILQKRYSKLKISNSHYAQIFLMLLTFSLFNLTGIFFRSPGVMNALEMFKALFTIKTETIQLFTSTQAIFAFLVIISTLVIHWHLRNSSIEEGFSKLPDWMQSLLIAIMILGIILFPVKNNAFIYFQF